MMGYVAKYWPFRENCTTSQFTASAAKSSVKLRHNVKDRMQHAIGGLTPSTGIVGMLHPSLLN
jgi:hypothetical protein